jgi:hypothetical protein
MKSIEVRLSPNYWLGVIGMFSLGVGGFLFWLFTRKAYPKLIDESGITAINGKRYQWENLRDVERVRLLLVGSHIRISSELNLQFADGRIHIKPIMIGNADEIFHWLSGYFGRTVTPG